MLLVAVPFGVLVATGAGDGDGATGGSVLAATAGGTGAGGIAGVACGVVSGSGEAMGGAGAGAAGGDTVSREGDAETEAARCGSIAR